MYNELFKKNLVLIAGKAGIGFKTDIFKIADSE